LARDVVCGTVLGDGSLNANSAHLTMSHSESQSDYALFKAELLAELAPKTAWFEVAAVVGGPESHSVIQVRTLAHRALKILRHDFYTGRKVVPSWIQDELNERMLAVWFLDDGDTRIRPRRQPVAEIATN